MQMKVAAWKEYLKPNKLPSLVPPEEETEFTAAERLVSILLFFHLEGWRKETQKLQSLSQVFHARRQLMERSSRNVPREVPRRKEAEASVPSGPRPRWGAAPLPSDGQCVAPEMQKSRKPMPSPNKDRDQAIHQETGNYTQLWQWNPSRVTARELRVQPSIAGWYAGA